MTDRSLLAVERDPGRYDLYGGRQCEARLLAADHSMETLLADHVDFLAHETLRRCDRDGTETYRVLRFSLPTGRGVVGGSEWIGRGVLLSVRYRLDPEDDGYVRGWFEGVRETLGELLDAGAITLREAFDLLENAIRRFGVDRDLLFDPVRGDGIE
ncbi:MAG: DUF6735 family protein [Halobacteriales archaeon]